MFTCTKCGAQFKSFYTASTHEKSCTLTILKEEAK